MSETMGRALYTIKSTVNHSDTSRIHVEIKIPNQRAFRRKALILFICCLLRKPPQADKA